MDLTLHLQSVAKNGIARYKADSQRTTGVVYLDKKSFVGDAPATLVISADNLAAPLEKPAPKPRKVKAAAEVPAEG